MILEILSKINFHYGIKLNQNQNFCDQMQVQGGAKILGQMGQWRGVSLIEL